MCPSAAEKLTQEGCEDEGTRIFEEFESLYYFHGSTELGDAGLSFRNQYEIILFLNDGALLEIGDRVHHVMKGDLFFINNREYHRTSGAEGKSVQPLCSDV